MEYCIEGKKPEDIRLAIDTARASGMTLFALLLDHVSTEDSSLGTNNLWTKKVVKSRLNSIWNNSGCFFSSTGAGYTGRGL